ncbi:hypothetical protein [Xylophilus sp. GOD-11R]|uniref:glycine zipper 2TM domain-containing protein n=1 Tax=Xylophilus sp. GOD-11R TaxID=3089814 RepID=UPI00298D0BA6|nr:hypothetical protein [Xylophilus sp. GOD-11R]WPB55984.1 hypothetical protein R9X41_17810 [Xylophilus sp. GOD-11R]
MKQVLAFSAFALVGVSAFAQSTAAHDSREMGRVLSTVPVVQQVPVTQQVCGSQQVVSQAPSSGVGTVLGGLAGGVVGNAIGHGGGRAAATALGIVGGAMLGNSAEGPGRTYVQDVPTCSTQTTYENRTVGYDVTYEYAGRRYTTRMASDPGEYIPVQVGAAGNTAPQQVYSASTAPATVEQGVVVSPGYATTTTVAPVVYTQSYAPAYAPVYAPAPYYGGGYGYGYGGPPIGMSLNLGYTHFGGHGRWR